MTKKDNQPLSYHLVSVAAITGAPISAMHKIMRQTIQDRVSYHS